MQSTSFPAQNLGKSASLTDGRFRIQLSRLGMGERIISQQVSEPFTTAAVPRERPVLGNG